MKIWEAGNDGGARAQVWDVDGAVGATAKAGDEADGGQKRVSKEKQIEENESVACIMLAEWPLRNSYGILSLGRGNQFPRLAGEN